MITKVPSSNEILWFCYMSYGAWVCINVVKCVPPSGLWIATDDIQGICGITAEIPWQAPSHAFLLRCHHARGERVGKGQATVFSWGKICRGPDCLIKGSPFCWACDFMKTSSHFQLFKYTFPADNLPKLFFWTIVHGLEDSLHSTGDLNNSACKIHQWCASAARGGGGEDGWVLSHFENRI